ncbi:Transcriptional adapter ADA2b [Sesamum angolense]|uniref:Transcriptional adapter ADA2b n=1 Tax=Sesamum angolense TaxID=2727404 RepID=A0AAE1W4U1_9LAMI|nr:Transcriptional adapter ADA2b [Sesamum angolense]
MQSASGTSATQANIHPDGDVGAHLHPHQSDHPYRVMDLTHFAGKTKEELLAMAKGHRQGKKGLKIPIKVVLLVVYLPPQLQVVITRKDMNFDIEYDNDAEELLVDMEFKESDDEWERGLKLRTICTYSKRVDERNRRKDFIIERGLLHPRPFERDFSKEERRKCRHYDVFMRLHSKEEHEELLKCVISVHRTLKRLQELKEARAAGCRSVAEADRYIEQKKQRLSEDGDHWTEIPQAGPSNPENSTSPVSSDSFDTYLTKTSAGQATSSTDFYSVTTSAANTLSFHFLSIQFCLLQFKAAAN